MGFLFSSGRERGACPLHDGFSFLVGEESKNQKKSHLRLMEFNSYSSSKEVDKFSKNKGLQSRFKILRSYLFIGSFLL